MSGLSDVVVRLHADACGTGPAIDFNRLDSALIAIEELEDLARKVAGLNRDAGEIGPGMLAQLVDAARAALARVQGGAL